MSILWLFLIFTAIEAGQESYFPYAQPRGGNFQPQGSYSSRPTGNEPPVFGRPQQSSRPVHRAPSYPPGESRYPPQGAGPTSPQSYGYSRQGVSNHQPQKLGYGPRDQGNRPTGYGIGQQGSQYLHQPQNTETTVKRGGNDRLLFDYKASRSSLFPALGIFSQLGTNNGMKLTYKTSSSPISSGNDRYSGSFDNFPRLEIPPPSAPDFRRPDPGETYGRQSPYEKNPYPDNPYAPLKKDQQSTQGPTRPSHSGRQRPYQNQEPGQPRHQVYNSHPPTPDQKPPASHQQRPDQLKQQNAVPNQPSSSFSSPYANSGLLGRNKGFGAFPSSFFKANSNNPQYPKKSVQQANNPHQQGAYLDLPISSLYPPNIPIKAPNPHGIQENQRKRNPVSYSSPQGVSQGRPYPPRTSPPQGYPVSSGGRLFPKQPTNSHFQNQPKPQQNVSVFGNPPSYQYPNGLGPRGPGFSLYSVNARLTPNNNVVHSGSQQHLPRIHYPQSSSKAASYFPPAQNAQSYPSVSQSSGYPSVFRNAQTSSAAGGGRNVNSYTSNDKHTNGDNFSKSNAYSSSDGRSTASAGKSGYSTKNQYSGQTNDQDSFKNRKTGGSRDSYKNHYNTNYNYDSKNKPSSSNAEVPVSIGIANQKSSATGNGNPTLPPLHGVQPKPKVATSAATPSKSGNVFTDTFSALGLQKSGGLWGNRAFPSFTQFLGVELENMF